MSYSVVGCCEIDKHSSGLLLSRKAIFDLLCQQGDPVVGRPSVSNPACSCGSKSDRFDKTIDESLEDFKDLG